MPVDILPGVRASFEAYGHSADLKDALAVRHEPSRNFYAILFKDQDGELFAVTFQQLDGEWELTDEGVSPFASVKDFMSERLTSSLF